MEKAMTEDTQSDEEVPDRRKHGYADLEKKLDDHAEKLDKRLAAFIRQGMIVFGILALTNTISLVGFGILLSKQGQTTADIQTQRRESILRSCLEQNVRHDNTINQLKIITAANLKQRPKEASKIKESVAPTIALIDALAPKKECAKLVKESVDGG